MSRYTISISFRYMYIVSKLYETFDNPSIILLVPAVRVGDRYYASLNNLYLMHRYWDNADLYEMKTIDNLSKANKYLWDCDGDFKRHYIAVFNIYSNKPDIKVIPIEKYVPYLAHGTEDDIINLFNKVADLSMKNRIEQLEKYIDPEKYSNKSMWCCCGIAVSMWEEYINIPHIDFEEVHPYTMYRVLKFAEKNLRRSVLFVTRVKYSEKSNEFYQYGWPIEKYTVVLHRREKPIVSLEINYDVAKRFRDYNRYYVFVYRRSYWDYREEVVVFAEIDKDIDLDNFDDVEFTDKAMQKFVEEHDVDKSTGKEFVLDKVV